MKNKGLVKGFFIGVFLSGSLLFCPRGYSQEAGGELRVVLIRHGEKPRKGDNLTCQGLNRSLALPAVLYGKFGIPTAIYVPSPGLGDSTKHARMFETIVPFAVKYNLALNTSFAEKDSAGIARAILQRKGVVLVVWEHKAIAPIAHALGVKDGSLKWGDEDYDSIWVIRWKNGAAVLEKGSEGLRPGAACPF